MPVINRIAEFHDEVTAWRRDLHENPELLYDVHRTAGIVAEKLKAFGCDEVVPGIGKTGVVGVIRGKSNTSGRVIGLRADMDALPIEEITGVPYASKVPGKMHACGHDGHTAMLLGAAKYLAETRNFDGTAIIIFQPAEEGGAGGKAMVDDGMMERWGIQEVYGMHNAPGLPVGTFATRPGALLAAADFFTIEVEGKGSHAAEPHKGVDTLVVAANILLALQSIVARNLDPLKSGVVTVGAFNGGHAHNVIPQTVKMLGTVRTLVPEVRDLLEKRVRETAEGIAAAYGAVAKVDYQRNYPVTVNHPKETDFAVKVAREVAGADKVEPNVTPIMGGEDFSFMLESRPGNMIWIGNGDTAACHHPAYDFNDAAIPHGVTYWVRLVETGMPSR
ncbi:MAG TPA: M20 aminoacylase family protein [Hyphomicrobiaceae bacterium]|nr:M20 aminoacylase family protein [Hyphomicrobiaceae bacterium]